MWCMSDGVCMFHDDAAAAPAINQVIMQQTYVLAFDRRLHHVCCMQWCATGYTASSCCEHEYLRLLVQIADFFIVDWVSAGC